MRIAILFSLLFISFAAWAADRAASVDDALVTVDEENGRFHDDELPLPFALYAVKTKKFPPTPAQCQGLPVATGNRSSWEQGFYEALAGQRSGITLPTGAAASVTPPARRNCQDYRAAENSSNPTLKRQLDCCQAAYNRGLGWLARLLNRPDYTTRKFGPREQRCRLEYRIGKKLAARECERAPASSCEATDVSDSDSLQGLRTVRYTGCFTLGYATTLSSCELQTRAWLKKNRISISSRNDASEKQGQSVQGRSYGKGGRGGWGRRGRFGSEGADE